MTQLMAPMWAEKRVGKRLDATVHTRNEELHNCLESDIKEQVASPKLRAWDEG